MKTLSTLLSRPYGTIAYSMRSFMLSNRSSISGIRGVQRRSVHIFIPGQLSFWQRYGNPLSTCFAIATGTTLTLHLLQEALCSQYKRRLDEEEIKRLEQRIEELEQLCT
ncbi:hypothetical protein BDF22DRAFT_742064 [Syncephalis plumigaleata]|nr:hypothetical protein BDF22DRAFT_742064 [Syncephalis plumigaleata]